jgi:hypothetical protein
MYLRAARYVLFRDDILINVHCHLYTIEQLFVKDN